MNIFALLIGLGVSLAVACTILVIVKLMTRPRYKQSSCPQRNKLPEGDNTWKLGFGARYATRRTGYYGETTLAYCKDCGYTSPGGSLSKKQYHP